MKWSNSIKALRKKKLITQTELAILLGVSFVTVNRYENDVFEPTMKIKRKLVTLFKKNGIKYE